MVQLLGSRAVRWRTLAVLMSFGLLTNTVVGALCAARIVTIVSSRIATMFLWCPPAVDERLLPMLHSIAQLRGHKGIISGYFALHMLIGILLAIGLWKMNRWAAGITTVIVALKLTLVVVGAVPVIKDGTSISWLVTLGWIPAFVWFAVYAFLLWADWISRGARSAVTFVSSFRRERIPLG